MGSKAPQEGRWRWRVSHLFWGFTTIFMMGWAFFLGLMVGQGSLGTPEQMDSLRGLTRTLPGMERLSPAEPAQPPREEVRLSKPDLEFWDTVVKGPDEQPPAAVTQPKPPAPPAAPTVAPLAPAAPVAPARTGGPVLGRPEPFRPETAPPVALPTPPARPAPAPVQAPVRPQPAAPQPQPFNPQPQPFRPAPGQAASASPRPAPQAAAPRQSRFTVQVASLQDEYQARDLAARLKSSGYSVYVVKAQMEGVGARYRVRVGPFDDFDRAQGAASRIRLQQTLAAYVTKED